MPISDGVLDLSVTDVTEESWEQLVADMAGEDPEVLDVLRRPVMSSISPGSCVPCSCIFCGT